MAVRESQGTLSEAMNSGYDLLPIAAFNNYIERKHRCRL